MLDYQDFQIIRCQTKGIFLYLEFGNWLQDLEFCLWRYWGWTGRI